MNKAFVREPDADLPGYCPRCGTAGIPVAQGPLNTHIRDEFRGQFGDDGWYCSYARCEVAYFDLFERVILVSQLKATVYPYDLDAPICACFGLNYDDVQADARQDSPVRIRELLEKSKSSEAQCGVRAVDGQCCLREVQRLYMKLRGS